MNPSIMLTSDTPLKLLAKAGMRSAAANLVASYVRGPETEQDGPRLLCLMRSHFSRDVAELKRRSKLTILELPSAMLTRVQSGMVPWEELNLPETQTWFADCQHPAAVAARQRTLRLGHVMLKALQARHRIDAVLSANVDYWQENALQVACAERGVPFLVLSKEHYVSDFFAGRRIKKCRESGFRFKGAGVAVFGACTVDTLVEPGGCGKEHVWITGAPRFDEWRRPEIADPPLEQRKNITMLSFSRVLTVDDALFSALKVFAEASIEHQGRGVKFIVKCKNGEDRDRVGKVLSGFSNHKIDVRVGLSVAKLLGHSRLIIGYNSTALLEALLGRATLAVPNWADAARDPAELVFNPNDPETSAVMQFLSSPDAFKTAINQAVEINEPATDTEARLRLLRKYYYVPENTTSCEEVERFVRHYVGECDK